MTDTLDLFAGLDDLPLNPYQEFAAVPVKAEIAWETHGLEGCPVTGEKCLHSCHAEEPCYYLLKGCLYDR